MNLAQAVLATLKYCDHFDFPLTLAEVYTRLIRAHASQRELLNQIQPLIKLRRIEKTGEYYHLPERRTIVARRAKRYLDSAPLHKRAHQLADQLGSIPGVLAIYLTGSLAMHNSGSNADIDFMIITRPNRLWTTRLLLTVYAEILGLRRRPFSANTSGKLCLNLYLTPNSYLLIPGKRSLYTAYELIQAVPLYDPQNTRANLLAANSWIADFLPNYPMKPDVTKLRTLQNASARNFWDLLEKIAYHLQLAYMRRKVTREYITQNAAFFHPHDPSPKVK